MQCTDKNKLINYIERGMTEKRRIHTYAVVEEAKRLSARYGADMDKAELAALFHDVFRGISEMEINSYIKKLGLGTAYQNNINLAHGKIAAFIMEKDYNINDSDILNAVSFHTTGRANMSKLEKIIYLADAIEKNRVYPGVEEIRELAYHDLEKACLLSMEHSIQYVLDRGLYLDQATILARDSLKNEIDNRN